MELKLDLCLALGKTQDELLSQMSTQDLIEWAAYKRIKPFGYDVDNMKIGEICASIINAAGKSFTKNAKWTDFFTPSYEVGALNNQEKTDPVSSLCQVFAAMAAQQSKQDQANKEKKKATLINKES